MKPVDFRNATYDRLYMDLSGLRVFVYNALRFFGPCTTRALAHSMREDILSIRPRITELVAMGLVRLSDHQPSKTEGRYEVATREQWEAFRAEKIETDGDGDMSKCVPSCETSCLCDCGCFLVSSEQECPICGASNPVYGNKSLAEREAEYEDREDDEDFDL